VDLLDEVAQHPLGHVEVGDDPIFERTHRDDVARGAADHAFSLDAHRDNLAVVGIERHHRRLVQHDAAAAHVDQCVRSTEIDRHVTAEESQRVAHREREPSAGFLISLELSRGAAPMERPVVFLSGKR